MLHPGLFNPVDIQAISRDGPRRDYAEVASKLLCSRRDASTTEIDEGMTLGCNHPTTRVAPADLIGLDALLAVMQTIHEEFGDPKYRPCPLVREMVVAVRTALTIAHRN